MSKCSVSFVDDLDGLTSKAMKIKKCNCFMNSNNHEAKNYHNQHFSTDTVKWKRIFFLLENTFIVMFKWCKQLYYVSPPTLSMRYEYQTKILKTEKRKKEMFFIIENVETFNWVLKLLGNKKFLFEVEVVIAVR